MEEGKGRRSLSLNVSELQVPGCPEGLTYGIPLAALGDRIKRDGLVLPCVSIGLQTKLSPFRME